MKAKSLLFFLISSIILLVLAWLGYLSIVIVLAHSMEPTVLKGSLAVAVKTNDYTIGDIILFKVHDKPVLHRIVSVKDDYYRTKGDNNTCRDPWRVPINAVGGKVITTIPYLGYVFWFLKKPIHFATLVTLLYVSFELRDRNIWKNNVIRIRHPVQCWAKRHLLRSVSSA